MNFRRSEFLLQKCCNKIKLFYVTPKSPKIIIMSRIFDIQLLYYLTQTSPQIRIDLTYFSHFLDCRFMISCPRFSNSPFTSDPPGRSKTPGMTSSMRQYEPSFYPSFYTFVPWHRIATNALSVSLFYSQFHGGFPAPHGLHRIFGDRSFHGWICSPRKMESC